MNAAEAEEGDYGERQSITAYGDNEAECVLEMATLLRPIHAGIAREQAFWSQPIRNVSLPIAGVVVGIYLIDAALGEGHATVEGAISAVIAVFVGLGILLCLVTLIDRGTKRR